MSRCVVPLLLVGVVAAATAQVAGPPQGRRIDATDITRLREFYRLADSLGDELWPGFDARTIPIAVNHDDRQELLVGHPHPPDTFVPVERLELNGYPIMAMEGRTRLGPAEGGWPVLLGGEWTVYVSTIRPGQSGEEYLSLILHEAFHVHQRRHLIFERPLDRREPTPELNPTYAALIALESRVLHAALVEPDDAIARELGHMFVAIRHERRMPISADVTRTEEGEEFSEGTATYVQARACQLLARRGGIAPLVPDPTYQGFRNAPDLYRDRIAKVLPPTGNLVTFDHGMFWNGMAQALLLDRWRPSWKTEIRKTGLTQFAILERELHSGTDRDETLAVGAKARFDFNAVLAEQTTAVNGRMAAITAHLEAPGRRYRIYWGDLPGDIDLSLAPGPVYTVPPEVVAASYKVIESLTGLPVSDPRGRAWIFPNGIRILEVGALRFESREGAIIYREGYLEWIDNNAVDSASAETIRYERQEEGVYVGLVVTTRGFVLNVPRALLERTKNAVVIHPVANR